MNLLRGILDFIAAIFRGFSDKQLSKSWWVRIRTENPEFTYYFGPFETRQLAKDKQPGFIEDLQGEGAMIAQSGVLWYDPPKITIEGTHAPV